MKLNYHVEKTDNVCTTLKFPPQTMCRSHKAVLFLFFTTLFIHSPSNADMPFFQRVWDNFHTVQKGALYRSGQLSPQSLEQYINEYNIKTIINLRGYNPGAFWWADEAALADKLDIHFHDISMTAQAYNSRANLMKLLDLYKTAPKPILIHCQHGADRCGEAAALWVLEIQKKSIKKALKQLSWKYHYIRSRHPHKYQFIKAWQGYEWLKNTYDPEDALLQLRLCQ